ncbi:MAG: cytochrome c maturation protein CcmE [Pseudomonadota bacterium]|nr:cytochrome c maturation protein CcmE [Pseudomonadota bacterium]
MDKSNKNFVNIAAIFLLLSSLCFLFIKVYIENNIKHYYSPLELTSSPAPTGAEVLLRAIVDRGSLRFDLQNLNAHFSVSDSKGRLNIAYGGTIPDFFREGKSIILLGKLESDKTFLAKKIIFDDISMVDDNIRSKDSIL